MNRYETTHPYIIAITINPVLFADFERLTEDRDEVRLLRREIGPDLWTLHVACASEEVARRMEEGWN
jgi:hypothetical protein